MSVNNKCFYISIVILDIISIRRMEVESYYRCGICNKKVGSGATPCGHCKLYVHLSCSKTTYKEAKEMGNKFVCLKCQLPENVNERESKEEACDDNKKGKKGKKRNSKAKERKLNTVVEETKPDPADAADTSEPSSVADLLSCSSPVFVGCSLNNNDDVVHSFVNKSLVPVCKVAASRNHGKMDPLSPGDWLDNSCGDESFLSALEGVTAIIKPSFDSGVALENGDSSIDFKTTTELELEPPSTTTEVEPHQSDVQVAIDSDSEAHEPPRKKGQLTGLKRLQPIDDSSSEPEIERVDPSMETSVDMDGQSPSEPEIEGVDDLETPVNMEGQSCSKQGDPTTHERVKLKWKGRTVMIGVYVNDSRETVVHGHTLPKGYAKYEIKTCFVNVLMKWEGYIPDKHVPGAFVAWAKKFAVKKKALLNQSPPVEPEQEYQRKIEDEKKMLDPCDCPRKCADIISEDERYSIHRQYWDKNYAERRTWVLHNIIAVNPNRRTVVGVHKRTSTRVYHLNKLQVCKCMFMNTLGYSSDKFITVALKNEQTTSMRGKHNHAYHSISSNDHEAMVKHIESYEPGISHYRREHAPYCLYVDPSLSIVDMYGSYTKLCVEKGVKVLSSSSYYRTIKEMNISFAKLGHEQCEGCLGYDEHPCLSDLVDSCECCAMLKKDGKKTPKRAKDVHCECCIRYTRNEKKPRTKREKVHLKCVKNLKCACCELHDNMKEKKEAEKLKCERCIEQTKHVTRKMEARTAHDADKAISESKDKVTRFFSLDLQKVRMIPEIPGVKTAVFTPRICVYNESFSPIGRDMGKSVAAVWHQGLMGRNDEDIASSFIKFITSHHLDNDCEHLVLWMDNCGPQNKNWTLYPAMIYIVNSEQCTLHSITLKYFEAGHTYMSADSFHHLIEQEANKLGYMYNFKDFQKCCENVGSVLTMTPTDFHLWRNELSQGSTSKNTRPLLEKVVVAQFQRGDVGMFFKESHKDENFKHTDFLKKKFKNDVLANLVDPPTTTYKGISEERKKKIIDSLFHLMPENTHYFWNKLKCYKD